MPHPFTVAGRYRNRRGAYTVLVIDGDQMAIRYGDGSEQTVPIASQARIWQNIQADEAPPLRIHRPDEYDSLEIQPVVELVQTVLATFSTPYPTDIIDQMCLAIERNPEWLARYDALIEHFSSRGKNGTNTVNSSIGFYTKELAGMVTLKEGNRAKSRLIGSYSTLSYGE
ncbi:MAG: hypothetical protein L0332_11270 [Chloroflexi bacterium]|nr:hypothetical protein [Chloroflexota bacterium]MCI0645980.1 hypothetical protein [Chloroflexota bacterium]MCI0727288.1 hypothetical protein [Chloroflexota bacterium]